MHFPRRSAPLITLVVLSSLSALAAPTLQGCPVLPADNVWNAPVDALPRHPNSDAYVATIGATRGMHPDFGTTYLGAPNGIPFVTVAGTQPRVPVTFEYADESDSGPYPVPRDAPIEGGPQSDGDRHVLVIDRDNCVLYELFAAYPNADGSWRAGSGAVYPLRSNALRPSGWTSADAAGLPIFAGLVRYDEVAAGEITHALRFTAAQTQRAFLWPARHFASNLTGPQFPPMGLRMRLKASFDVNGFPAPVQVILRALKKYGMILADNGSSWYISGVPDARWNDDMLVGELARVKGSDFEAVDASGLMADPQSGAVKASTNAAALVTEFYNTILDHYFVTSGDGERAAIDSGGAGPGWSRTGFSFNVSAGQREGWTPVCRFYGNPLLGTDGRRIGPNSHFYTVSPAECELVKKDKGWVYEGTAFHAVQSIDSSLCPVGTRALWRAYNNGFPAKDANHRYATDRSLLVAMASRGWSVEGVAMCVE
ncbi:MAG TPA: hypothetical protein VM051_07635 [Usitatibacter sp.]|nr:hypothetical protein [Usitatibacter sp.]